MRLELSPLQRGLGRIACRVGEMFSEKPPSWTVKDGKDIGLREKARQIRKTLVFALDDCGTAVGEEIFAGVGTNKHITGIIRGAVDPDLSMSDFLVCDDDASVSIESIVPVSIPAVLSGELHRGRIIFPADYNMRPSLVATCEGGREVDIELLDIEEELGEIEEAMKRYKLWGLTEQGARNFIEGYNHMFIQLPLSLEPEMIGELASL